MQNSRTLERSSVISEVRFDLRTIALVLASVIFASGCGGGSGQSANNPPPPPAPTINLISPITAEVGSAAFTLIISGTNFVSGSVVNFGGSQTTTTFVSATELTAAIPASDIVTQETLPVTVTNPAPGGGTSNAEDFNVVATRPPQGVSPQAIIVDPSGKFAYVMNTDCDDQGDGCVSMLSINSATGALTSLGTPISSDGYGIDYGDGDNAGSVAVDPFSKFIYVTNAGNVFNYDVEAQGTLATYTIDSTTGALTSTGSTNGNCPGLCFPMAVAVHPSGKFAYVTDGNEPGGTGSVLIYAINATTGALTSAGMIATDIGPVFVAIDPAGKFAYVANNASNDVSMYTIDATTGALTSVGTVATGSLPASVTIDPAGNFAYVTNSDSKSVSMFTIDATTGVLTSIGTVATGTGPVSMAIDPAGKFAYVTNSNSNNVSMYTINGTTGVLTPAGTVAAGQLPASIAIHPSGNFAYVANAISSNLSIYSIDPSTGALTLIGTTGL